MKTDDEQLGSMLLAATECGDMQKVQSLLQDGVGVNYKVSQIDWNMEWKG